MIRLIGASDRYQLLVVLDLNERRFCSGSFVSDELRKRHTDLLHSVPFDGEKVFCIY